MSDILVLVEHLRGEVRDVTLEMLAKAQALGQEAGLSVSAVLLASPAADIAGRVSGHCGRILTVEHPALKDFQPEAYEQALLRVMASERPKLLMIAHSALGADLAPALAAKAGLPLVSDVVGISRDAKGFLFTRQMYSGKLNADWRFKGEQGIITVRAAAFKPEKAGQCGKVSVLEPGEFSLRRRLLGYEEAPSTGVDITKASVIVAVGRGIKEQKNLTLVEQFAKAIGGEIGCSRPVIDAGWMPKDRQIGSSGKTVKPKIYIGLGISGAFQHTAGIKGAETIIAVNKDPNAPIFALAHYGIVGDIMKVIPALETRIKELKAA